jgi:hypothetical protein
MLPCAGTACCDDAERITGGAVRCLASDGGDAAPPTADGAAVFEGAGSACARGVRARRTVDKVDVEEAPSELRERDLRLCGCVGILGPRKRLRGCS